MICFITLFYLFQATAYNINDKSFTKKMKYREKMNLAVVITYIVSTVTFYIMQVCNLINNYGTESTYCLRKGRLTIMTNFGPP